MIALTLSVISLALLALLVRHTVKHWHDDEYGNDERIQNLERRINAIKRRD